MSIFQAMNASGSALTAQRLRMDVASSNIANANSTRASINEAGEWEPYQRKMVVLEPERQNFRHVLQQSTENGSASGVKASEIVEDEEPFKMAYNPSHPDADDEGYVRVPNVDPLQEMVDMMSATRSYEASVTSLNASKSMLMKALEIGR
ncbi:flagellar basal body rod protein FlgC [Halobacillus kuroshimensis]|uniref:Flagellar basal-body rod protein FlgC n=1 Tax=Halobacillus kuroshimensis TaxID=302481 RepID=A0ABS3DSZ5_9BACI|nr:MULTISPECIES: flagellar basal body rod protein FlgC [Halobacillus]MBN8234445.1 flagellar basal body rod protein FlgC [Halobacillus kuroshimensis]